MADIHGKPLAIRLFLEGIEVPCIAIHLKIGMNAPATADIEVVPTDRAVDLLGRTMVHAFYYDPNLAPDAKHVDEKYRLLFMGEVIGTNFIKTPTSRAVVLQCLDFSLYWDTAYQMMLDYGPNGNFFMGNAAAFLGAKTNLFNSLGIGGDITTVLSRLVQGQPSTPGLSKLPKGLMAGIVKVMEAVSGVPSEFTGVNDFFTIAELRVRLLHQIGAAPHDRTPEYLLKRKAFNKFLRNELGGGGGLFSLRDIIKMLCKYIVHDVVPNPSAMYVSPRAERIKENYTPLRDPKMVGPFKNLKEARAQVRKARQAVRSTNIYLGAIRSNADFQAKNSALQTQDSSTYTESGVAFRAYARQSKRRARINETRLKLFEASKLALNARNLVHQAITGLPKSAVGVRKYITRALTLLGQSWDKLTPVGIFVNVGEAIFLEQDFEVVFDEAFTSNKKTLTQLSDAAKDLARRLKQAQGLLSNGMNQMFSETRDVWELEDARVPSQLFYPDIWFAAPPTCNVLFPSDYVQLNFQRGMLREVSRLQLSSALMLGGRVHRDRLLKTYYFAPAIEEFQKVTQGCRYFMSSPTIMSHEIHSGIIPKMESIAEVGRFVKQAQAAVLGKDTGSKLNYIQRIANYNFFRHRYAARSANFAGPTRIRLVCGLPAVLLLGGTAVPEVIDQDKDSLGLVITPTKPEEAIKRIVNDRMRIVNSPRHMIGKLVALGHSITQQGGNSNGTMQYVRTYSRDDIDMLRAMAGDQIQKSEASGTKTYELEAATLAKNKDVKQLALLAAVTPQRKRKSGAVEGEERDRGWPRKDALPNPAELTIGSRDPITGGKIIEINFVSSLSYLDPERRGEPRLTTQKASMRNKGAGIRFYSGGLGGIASNRLHSTKRLNIVEVAKSGSDSPWVWALLQEFDIAQSATVVVQMTKASVADIVEVPFEDRVRPYWMDSGTYAPENISDEFYDPLLGCSAITDKFNLGEFISGKAIRGGGIKEPLSVDQSIDILSIIYAVASGTPGAVDRFVEDYTRRPVASMIDILGNPRLGYILTPDKNLQVTESSDSGDRVVGEAPRRGEYLREAPGSTRGETLEIVKLEGFHSRSISETLATEGNLAGLAPASSVVQDRKLTKAGQDIRIPGRLDPRPEKRRRVRDYVDQLTIGVGNVQSGAKGLEG